MTIEEKKQLLRKYGEIDDRIEQLRRAKENSRLCDRYQSPEFNEEVKGGRVCGSIVEIIVTERNYQKDSKSILRTARLLTKTVH